MISRKTYVLLGAFIFLSICGFSFIYFLDYHETRVDNGGILFNDPVFNVLPIADCSFFIFAITYGSMLLYAASNYKQPFVLTRFMLAYGLLLLFRIVTLSILPLKEPDTLVYLEDPFLNNLIYPGNIDADLFFSGHTGLVFILFFLTRKFIFIVLGIILGVLLIVQRVHYSIDILAAVPFAYVIVKSVDLSLDKIINEDVTNP